MEKDSIPFFNFLDAPVKLRLEWQSSIEEVIAKGRFIGGDHVTAFEEQWAHYLEVKHCIGVGNGLDAIVLALRALEIGPGDLVAVPAHTFIATWLAVEAVGATPVGIDCDKNGLLDLDDLMQSDLKLKAVIPVHMHGQMVAMDSLMKWAIEKDVFVIEDCAQAHGAQWKGKKAGAWGHVNAFSFYPTKNLGAIGDAGAVVTNDAQIAKKIRSISNYGSKTNSKYEYEYLGVNSRLDPIQAAVLSVNLTHLDAWNISRNNIARKYIESNLELGTRVLNSPDNSVWHHFVLLSDNRSDSIKLLRENGILCDIHYPRVAADVYSELKHLPQIEFKVASRITSNAISVPISPWMDDSKVQQVIQALNDENILRTFLGEM